MVKLLIEMEELIDSDRTTDADSNGDFGSQPSGKIRVSAFYGEPDLDAARTQV